jgi:hypothetical protein
MLVAPYALAYCAKSFIKFDSKDSLWLLPFIFPPKFNLAKIFFSLVLSWAVFTILHFLRDL